MLTVFLIITLLLFFIGTPIFVALGIGSGLIALYCFGLPAAAIGNMFSSSLNSFTLLALPLFVLMGDLYLVSGADRPLIDLMSSLFGRLAGGMGMATVIACALFAAISGSSTATVVTIGIIMIPEMIRIGYRPPFASSIIAASGGLGNLIPPSIFFIIYGSLYELDIATLYAAGMIPGLLCAAMLSLTVYILAKRGKIVSKSFEKITWGERLNRLIRAIPSLIVPFVVLGGMYGGIFTPTEAAGVGCGTIMVIGFVIYRKMTVKHVWQALKHSVSTIGAIMIMVAGGIIIGKIFILSGIPDVINNFVIQKQFSPTVFLFLAGGVMAILGTFIECVLMIYVCAALFFSTVEALGLSPVHFGVTIVVASLVGMTTPPMCESIFVVSKISNVSSNQIIKQIYPFILAWLINFAIIIGFPEISLYLPRLMGLLGV